MIRSKDKEILGKMRMILPTLTGRILKIMKMSKNKFKKSSLTLILSFKI